MLNKRFNQAKVLPSYHHFFFSKEQKQHPDTGNVLFPVSSLLYFKHNRLTGQLTLPVWEPTCRPPVLKVFGFFSGKHSLATRYPGVSGQLGRRASLREYILDEAMAIIWAANRCFQQRSPASLGPLGSWGGKYQGSGIYDVAFWKQNRSNAAAVRQTRGAAYTMKMVGGEGGAREVLL